MSKKPYEFCNPVWEYPEVQEKVKKVMHFISTSIAARNLFAWRDFVEELKSDIELEIYKYEDLYLQGKYKKTGVGAYCNMAIQGAVNYKEMYNIPKRKANYEALSLDSMLDTGDGVIPFQVAAVDNHVDDIDLLISIEAQLGKEVRDLAERVLNGESLSQQALADRELTKEEKSQLKKAETEKLKKLQTPQMRALLKGALR